MLVFLRSRYRETRRRVSSSSWAGWLNRRERSHTTASFIHYLPDQALGSPTLGFQIDVPFGHPEFGVPEHVLRKAVPGRRR
ncbi:unnamed protein product [Callosobruchus maculatus]|uniref:Uncharacterized protein n=1 Tax=Callosobruchus maculatus TaxID=64391 RepID=A0A653BTX1_CALMS|nr:unnamed protein product [Callosobruchus maculatus]